MSPWLWLLLVPALPALLLLALALPLRFELDIDERGGSGRLRWLGFGVAFDQRRNEMELRLAGWRLLRRPLAAGKKPPPAAKREARSGGRPQLSWRGRLALGRVALREAGVILRRFRLERLRLELVVASGEPALTGELFGYGSAVVSALGALWPQADLRLTSDFARTRPRGHLDTAARVRPILLLGSAWRLARAFLKGRRRDRRA